MRSENISIDQLFVSSLNVRKTMDAGEEDAGIHELADSIKNHGLLSPLIVRETKAGRYEILAGQRRFLACRSIGLNPVTCLVRDSVSDEDAMTLSLVENVHRAEMSPMDKARALNQLYDRFGSYDRVAKESGWSAQTIKKYIKLLELPETLQDQLSTSNGAAGVGMLSRLAESFKGNEAIEVFGRIAGFNSRVQSEILKQAKGDISIIDDLVEEAHEGIFDVRRCGGMHGCQVIQDIVENRLSKKDFEKSLNTALSKRHFSDEEYKAVKDAAWTFWKALAVGKDLN